jgi:hypothetical protein
MTPNYRLPSCRISAGSVGRALLSPLIGGLRGALPSAPTCGHVEVGLGRVDTFALDHAGHVERWTARGRRAQRPDGIACRARAGLRNPGR